MFLIMAKEINIADGYCANDFFEYGWDHIEAGFELLKLGNPRFYDSAGYLICIGYECLLKAWLLHSNKSTPAIHDIEKLSQNITCLNLLNMLEKMEGIKKLNQCSVQGGIRYPNHHSPVSIGTEDFEIFYQLIKFTYDHMPEDLKIQQEGEHFIKGRRILMSKPR